MSREFVSVGSIGLQGPIMRIRSCSRSSDRDEIPNNVPHLSMETHQDPKQAIAMDSNLLRSRARI